MKKVFSLTLILFSMVAFAQQPALGDPNSKSIPEWPAFSDAKSNVMYFGKTPHTGPVPGAESLKVLGAYFAWRRAPEGKEWTK